MLWVFNCKKMVGRGSSKKEADARAGKKHTAMFYLHCNRWWIQQTWSCSRKPWRRQRWRWRGARPRWSGREGRSSSGCSRRSAAGSPPPPPFCSTPCWRLFLWFPVWPWQGSEGGSALTADRDLDHLSFCSPPMPFAGCRFLSPHVSGWNRTCTSGRRFKGFLCRACDARPVEVGAGQKVQLQLVHNAMMCHKTRWNMHRIAW